MMPLRLRIPQTLASRLRDTRGFMLAEQLVSIIFIGLLCIVVSAGLSAAMSAYASITTQTKADALLAEAVERVSDEMAFALSVDGGGNLENDPTFVSGSRNEKGKLVEDSLGIWFKADSGNNVLLVSSQNGFTPSIEGITYYRKASDTIPANTWTFTIKITNSSGTVVAQTPSDTEMRVRRIG